MYIPRAFSVTDETTLIDTIGSWPLGTLVKTAAGNVQDGNSRLTAAPPQSLSPMVRVPE